MDNIVTSYVTVDKPAVYRDIKYNLHIILSESKKPWQQ